MDCLIFADDMALITDSLENAQEQITELKKQAGKVVQISFEKHSLWQTSGMHFNTLR